MSRPLMSYVVDWCCIKMDIASAFFGKTSKDAVTVTDSSTEA